MLLPWNTIGHAHTYTIQHGPWNSWDRVPYITTLRSGKPSIVPADRHIHHNFIIANYNSEGAIDTDGAAAAARSFSKLRPLSEI